MASWNAYREAAMERGEDFMPFEDFQDFWYQELETEG
jgi:hypothetical protein